MTALPDHLFLSWLADRLVDVYHESPTTDFVQRLRRMSADASPSDIPIPGPKGKSRRFNYPFAEMTLEGGSFLVRCDTKDYNLIVNRIFASFHGWKNRHGHPDWAITTRRIAEEGGIRVWRIR